MEIKDAYYVIHYSPPLLNFRQFQKRFMVQSEHFSCDKSNGSKAPTCWILMDETNELQWAKMTELAGSNIPAEFVQTGKVN